MSSTKNDRVELRMSSADRQLLESAAEHVHETLSDFTRSAAVQRAQNVLARTAITLMPADQFDGLLHSLDVADPAPKLAEVAARPRRFERK
ncbi:DUF1778 domain-containing protein [Amycolatopsis magusensis]|uniref:Uncharacterized protein (DUF1778 family) n=1 Tax=Amycolatopsis magusensis TaxID=882444 RepID=A0ABS4PI90_9PSEU|nr:DUF1778 domain-containing protein [Amycolatopsis magusensis]MBP2179133.1 uncharacterized protein (DUF1778 family) [Amycolatopsis magusensis]MDI5977496.1 DUF1778 domain-containing protein [Amycolatopsis magusensis]